MVLFQDSRVKCIVSSQPRPVGKLGIMALPLSILAMTFGFALTIVAYEDFAEYKGWTVGEAYRDRASLVVLFSYFGLLGAPIITLIVFPWWTIIIALIGGLFFGLLVTETLKARVQVVAPVGLAVCWVLDMVYVL